MLRAHRVAWELEKGPIPDGLSVCHTCDTPRCVNVAHLFVGTNADNMADRNAKARQARGERHGRARLTTEQVIGIKALLATGTPTQGAIAGRLGVSPWTIEAIARGKRWGHVDTPASAATLTRASDINRAANVAPNATSAA